MLFGYILYQCWPLCTLVFIAYQLFLYNNQPGMNSRECQLLYTYLVSHREILLHLVLQYLFFILDTFNPYSDAQAEGRTASK